MTNSNIDNVRMGRRNYRELLKSLTDSEIKREWEEANMLIITGRDTKMFSQYAQMTWQDHRQNLADELVLRGMIK